MSASGSDGRAALVTGATGVVGRAVVARLQAEGFAVAGVDRGDGGGDLPLAVDVTDREAMRAAAERTTSELGAIEVLVTAHGYHAAAPFGEMSREDWRRLLDAHLGGTVNACAAVVPGMVAAGLGTVVTTSSWIALAGVPGEAYYAAATGAILAFTKSFSLEVAPKGVRVNCIALGPVETGAEAQRFSPGQPAPEELPLRRYVTPEEIAATVSFLIRDGDFMVGQIFTPAAGAVV
jgi:NAD(P)-dependent dehydrogenase (short-subunit alcohol dehydrogenase family)